MDVATGLVRRHPRGVILTRGLVAAPLVVLTGILLAYGYWGAALFALAAAVVHGGDAGVRWAGWW